MTDYGRSAHEQREYDRLHYPGTDVLKNKLDIRQPELLAEAEQLYVTDRLREALPAAARIWATMIRDMSVSFGVACRPRGGISHSMRETS